MRLPVRVVLFAAGTYLAAWAAYTVKSAVGIDLIAADVPIVGGHHGPMFPGSDRSVQFLRRLLRQT